MISDTSLELYDAYGVEQSTSALLRAFFFNFSEIIKGFAKGGRPSKKPHFNIVPADFLIDIDGQISEVWYGKDTADHIPMETLEKFASAEEITSRREMEAELDLLRAENRRLKNQE